MEEVTKFTKKGVIDIRLEISNGDYKTFRQLHYKEVECSAKSYDVKELQQSVMGMLYGMINALIPARWEHTGEHLWESQVNNNIKMTANFMEEDNGEAEGGEA